MSFIDEVKQHKYVGMPFHAVGFPQPVYSHLMVSDDGVNWDDLRQYNFGWRDTDIAYINGEFWTCTGTYVNHTTDFDNFTQVQCPNMGLKNLWASEFFQDNNEDWWFVYCGSETDVDYSEYKLYASRMYPEKYQIDGVRNDIQLNAAGGYIDPNINYINGYYYLWCSKTSTPTQELHLFRSTSILGPYDEVQTNIMSLTNSTGFTWNEAPEMLQINGVYYLYSDPWNKGENESDRDVYRCESADLVTWSNMKPLESDCTMRHFTPLYIGDIKFDTAQPERPSTPSTPNTPGTSTPSTPSVPNTPPTSDSANQGNQVQTSVINLWNGDVNTFYQTNRNNYIGVNNFISEMNNSGNPFVEQITIRLDDSNKQEINRSAYLQFINNADTLIKWLPEMVEEYRLTDYDFTCTPPKTPEDIYFNQTKVNEFWTWVKTCIDWIVGQIKQVS